MAIPRLLVVDDDPEMRSMLTQFLRQNGFIALPAATESDIRKQISADRIDLILLDVMLGDESGVDICKSLRAEQDVPVIFISALSADHHRMKGYEVGADDYIGKPFEPKELLLRIKNIINKNVKMNIKSKCRWLPSNAQSFGLLAWKREVFNHGI